MEIRISGGLYAFILLVMGVVMQFMLLSAPLIGRAGQEAWISALLGGVYGLAVTLPVVWIACQFPGRDPLAAITCQVGGWATVPIRLLYSALHLGMYSLALRDIQDFVEILVLPGTPGMVIGFLICGVTLYAVMSGLEPIARTSFGVMVMGIIILALLPLALYREFSILQVDPFLWKGLDGVLSGAIPAFPWAGESILVLSLLRHLSPKANPFRWTIIGVGSAAGMLAMTLGLITLVFGSVLPSRQLYPGFELLAIIAVTEGIERIQAAVIIVWIAGSLLKIALNLYAAVEEGGLAPGSAQPPGLYPCDGVDWAGTVAGLDRRAPRDIVNRSARMDPTSARHPVGDRPVAGWSDTSGEAASKGEPAWVGWPQPSCSFWCCSRAAGAASS